MGHPGGSRVHGIAPLTHIYCSPCCQCPGMTKKYNVQSPWPAIHSLDCCSCRCFLWFLLDGQCDTHGQWDARKLRWQPGAAGKLCLITEGKQSVFTHKYANGIKNNNNNKPVWFRCFSAYLTAVLRWPRLTRSGGWYRLVSFCTVRPDAGLCLCRLEKSTKRTQLWNHLTGSEECV